MHNLTLKQAIHPSAYFVLLLFPILLLGFSIFLVIDEFNQKIHMSKQEITGLSHIAQVSQEVHLLQKIRGLNQLYLGGDDDALPELILNRQKHTHNLSVHTYQNIPSIRETYLKIQNQYLNTKTKQGDNRKQQLVKFELYSQLIASLNDITLNLSSSSKLALDNHIENRHLIDLHTYFIPLLLERVGKIRGLASYGLQNKQHHQQTKDLVSFHIYYLKELTGSIHRVLNELMILSDTHSLGLSLEIEKNLNDLNQYIEDFKSQNYGYAGARAMFNKGTVLIDELNQYRDKIQRQLLDNLQHRIDSKSRTLRLIIIAVTGAIMMLMIAIITLFRRNQQAFEKLTKSNNKLDDAQKTLSSTLENIVDGVITIDTKGSILSFNRSAQKLFGYSAHDVIGKNVSLLMPSPNSENHNDYLKFYDPQNPKLVGINREVEGLDNRGNLIPISLFVNEMQISGTRYFTGVIRDIRELKHNQNAILEKSRSLEIIALYESTQSYLMSLFANHTHEVEIFDKLLERLSIQHNTPVSAVYLRNEWKGCFTCSAHFGLSAKHPLEFKAGEGLIGQAASSGKQIFIQGQQENPFSIEAGLYTLKLSSVVASPITYGEKVIGVILLSYVSPPNKSELEFIERLASQIGVSLNNLRQFHDLKIMSEELKSRGEEISKKNSELQQSNKMKSQFLANMSHELRTPLNSVIGFSDMMIDGLAGDLNEEQLDYSTEIYNNAKHLLSLINDILDLSKVESGKMELQLDKVDINYLVKNSLSIIKEIALKNKVAVNITPDNSVIPFKADARKVKQVLYNILSNAIKFTQPGGRIDVNINHNAELVSIEITDTGIGIDTNKIDTIFKPFEQIDGSLSRKYDGTGLGLALVKSLVELHGGTINVTSTLGSGSSFVFTLPFNIEHETDNSHSESSDIHHSQDPQDISEILENQLPIANKTTSKVTLVEPDIKKGAFLSQLLIKSGYLVEVFESVAVMMEKLMEQLPDLIVIDVNEPDGKGWQELKKIYQYNRLKDVLVYPISLNQQHDAGLGLGCINMLEKTADKDTLLNSIRQALQDQVSDDEASILVVDDNESTLKIMKEQLSQHGYKVKTTNNAQQGLELAKSSSPNLIITDLMMPNISGFELVMQLRDNLKTRDIPIMILTSKTLTDSDYEMLNNRVEKIIEKKEFNPKKFIDDIEQTLGKKLDGNNKNKILSILVVEDDLKQAEMVKTNLNKDGFQVTLAANGLEAFTCMEQAKPDLILLDLLMPEMDGFTFLEEKSKRANFARIPVIVLSSIATSMEDYSFSADAILTKPIERTELIQMVNLLINVEKNKPDVKFKILLIDDDPKALKLISSFLSESHFDIIKAFGGAEGIQLSKSEHPDLIVLDLMMPEVNGFDVIKALKSSSDCCGIPILILSAKILTEQERKELQQAAEFVLEKGAVNRNLLVTEVERLLKRYNNI